MSPPKCPPKRRRYERPALTPAGSFAKKTGLGISGGPELLLLKRM
ncbi:hypothetical protein SNS2_1846 [Streptomyces netropsis]|uniref:Lasso RiPP family leader peptide-containing protein n=1 Tax=Streptomyces syringium TaxID=76729 RepID=A0ABS4Y3K8_9ACTN|nr:keywimysin-related RiPP [Streptomyces syringium]MBP2403230.1 hypothetical protein [Streptomyces syringium]SPE52992.1 hypothetical protein SNS2_1846 [Streptomyces netropsis]